MIRLRSSAIAPLAVCVVVSHLSIAVAAEPYNPVLATASDEGEKQIASFRVADGLKVSLAAAEPELANPVAFCFDERGRILVCETFRAGGAVIDNRGQMQWLDEDLAARTVQDREAYIKKNFPDFAKRFTEHHDRVRLLEDTNADGRFETSHVFADGFNQLVDGIGSGVLARGGDVFYTCIPKLWRLRDPGNTGQATERDALSDGYGVRWAFYGHDLHGLCLGPDGKLYYSIGDRGFCLTLGDKTVSMPDRGAVFRCNLDGSELEIVATGLRNPQELAFDKYGNLFTGDNNSDSGDAARWVHVVEGADTGWRMYYQYPGDRGPWNREKLWHEPFANQAAYVMPPIKHIPSGPSGLTFNPGVGMPAEYDGQFFLCDFHGGAQGSGVNGIKLKAKGASWEVESIKPLIQNVLATDVTFGPDSSMYVSDWVTGWSGQGKGRIYRIEQPTLKEDPLRVETQALLLSDFKKKDAAELARLLGHADMRVRLESQLALADLGAASIGTFAGVLKDSKEQMARIHSVWGLGIVGRKLPEAIIPVLEVTSDSDAEVRAQAAKIVGDAKYFEGRDRLITCLTDDAPRVRYLAAQSLGKLGSAEAAGPLVELLRANNDEDRVIRHAASRALSKCADAAKLAELAGDSVVAVRLGAVLALRHQQSPQLARFVADADPRVALEAATAIHDLQIAEALPAVAALTERPYSGDEMQKDALWRRVLNTHFREGKLENAKGVARFAARQDLPDATKREAMQMLADWTKPSNRDRVLGDWRPLEARDAAISTEAVRSALPQFLATQGIVKQLALQLAARVGLKEVVPMLIETVKDSTKSDSEAAEALAALEQLRDGRIQAAVSEAINDPRPTVRAIALGITARTRPADVVPAIEKALAGAEIVEKKAALAALASLPPGKADELVFASLDQLAAGTLPAELHLELLTSAAARKDTLVQDALGKHEAARKGDDPLALYRETLAGGDAERGRTLFFQKAEVYCVRCHKVAGIGGDVGPDLSKLGAEKTRDYLLESIVNPNKAIAKGFESVQLVLDDGHVIAGVLREENDTHVRLVTPEGQTMNVPKASIEDRATGKSPMPEDLVKKISKAELRDLVEFLSTQKTATEGH